jgi:hypothetical protein
VLLRQNCWPGLSIVVEKVKFVDIKDSLTCKLSYLQSIHCLKNSKAADVKWLKQV